MFWYNTILMGLNMLAFYQITGTEYHAYEIEDMNHIQFVHSKWAIFY